MTETTEHEPPVPPEAIAAALHAWRLDQGDEPPEALVRVLLEAAAPRIAAGVLARVEQGVADGAAEVIAQAAAAERERCARLAEQVNAAWLEETNRPIKNWRSFAALLREGDTP